MGRRRGPKELVLLRRAVLGSWGPGSRAHLSQSLSPVQVVVTVGRVIRLGRNTTQGPFQSCRKERELLQQAYPTRRPRESPSASRSPRGPAYHRDFTSWWLDSPVSVLIKSALFTNDTELQAPWGLIVHARQGALSTGLPRAPASSVLPGRNPKGLIYHPAHRALRRHWPVRLQQCCG